MATGHSGDLELAQRCAAGEEDAWERFVREFRPILYRSADALDPGGGAREIADALYAELYGLTERGGERQSLFRCYEGRSSLATWLRAVLAQRFVDCVRARRRLAPLPEQDEETDVPLAALAGRPSSPGAGPPDPDRARHVDFLQRALARAIAGLQPRDRLRLSCYYARQLTLAETGRLLKEHEATVSRQIARTRRALRDDVARRLRNEAGLGEAQIAECFAVVAADPGPLDLDDLLGKKLPVDRSI